MSFDANGEKPLSMRIEPGFDKDPLRKPRHHVVASQNGRDFFILGQPGQQFVTDPIELLKIEVGGQSAIAMQDADVRIMNDDHEEVARFEPCRVEPQDGPPDAERIAMRDRWLERVMQFLLPPSLYSVKDDPAKQDVLAKWFKKHRIAIEMRPDGGAIRIYRKGEILSEWGC